MSTSNGALPVRPVAELLRDLELRAASLRDKGYDGTAEMLREAHRAISEASSELEAAGIVGANDLADRIEALATLRAVWHGKFFAERGYTAQCRDALERAQGCIKGLLARTPVRDVTETLAEIDAALAKSTTASEVKRADAREAVHQIAETEASGPDTPRTVDCRDTLRLHWLAETMRLSGDDFGACDWNGTLLKMVLDRFKEWRREPGADVLDAMRRAIDTQVVHEDAHPHSSFNVTKEKS